MLAVHLMSLSQFSHSHTWNLWIIVGSALVESVQSVTWLKGHRSTSVSPVGKMTLGRAIAF